MKKSLIFALTALLAVSFTFFSCNPNEEEQKDNNTEQTGGEDPDNSGSGSEAGGVRIIAVLALAVQQK